MIARSRTFPGLYEPMIVDLFAGGGGASMGIERAFMAAGVDRHVDLAINHDPAAIACHEVNHPLTEHLQCDVIEVDPRKVCAGRRVGYLHASPDCTDFSIAKGGTPIRTKQRRSLAWVVVQWAAAVRPDVITLENVREFQQWGPVRTRKDGDGYEPCPRRRGERFAQWVAALRGLGYQVEWRKLREFDYGTPTTRNRLFLFARCDG